MKAIEVRDLSKKYSRPIATTNEDIWSIRSLLSRKIGALLKGQWGSSNPKEEFWALKNISLNINQGEVVGIIGQNGSGKSTLLKTLSRLAVPTTGEIRIHGTVCVMLASGTGFSGEFTGKENVFAGAAALGMRFEEIRKRYKQIVEFSGVQEFINMPFKRYSSGMQTKLAVSVALNLRADIIILDEVFVVSDVAFREKAYKKIQELVNSGFTILLVTHEHEILQSLCTRCIYLKDGHVQADGQDVEGIIESYLAAQKQRQ